MPVTLISPSNPALNAQAAKPIETAKTKQARVTSQSESKFTANSNKKTEPNTAAASPSSSQNRSKSVSEKLQQTRTQRADASVKSLFANTTEAQIESIPVLNSKQSEELSPYQQTLIKHLLAGELYDRFHAFMASTSQTEIKYSIELRLFENGAIKSASLTKKSSSLEIDRLAITAAYNASPYPRPPSEDFEVGYTYLIPMSYKKRGLEP
jgi:hypothetical protein